MCSRAHNPTIIRMSYLDFFSFVISVILTVSVKELVLKQW